jgi:hypothetical protein
MKYNFQRVHEKLRNKKKQVLHLVKTCSLLSDIQINYIFFFSEYIFFDA